MQEHPTVTHVAYAIEVQCDNTATVMATIPLTKEFATLINYDIFLLCISITVLACL